MTALSDLIETGSRAEIARGYADEILGWDESKGLMHGPPWSDWNRAIADRFGGVTALSQIKKEAWRLVDERER
jgi:hypothetical protein